MTQLSMRDRARALLARANDPASSEAEVNLCMQKSMDLMSKFGFTMDEISGDQAEDIGASYTRWTNGRPGGAMVYVQNAIAAFTNTRVAFKGCVSEGSAMTYHGYSAERDLAVWLHGHILNAIKVESANYDPGPYPPHIRAKDRKSFAIYMARRIAQRLYAMSETLDDAGRGTGTEVMIVKNKKLDDHYESLGFKKAVNRKVSVFSEGVEAGKRAGDNLSLRRPVSEQSAPLAISSI
ncbi:hypothetical protein ETW23_00325 [Leisingera sp. NJS201]|uniref:DUF7168 domain-containing protein n=1 Tax=Leisingera sp. NJS201 TaxID=2508306 RepID=UPI0010713F51|nr:hypothetical protein [Leisingera sp. NJS201]QBR34845.1 hypothetical protein ETW23_00325 [Leisingera sp. NJS201]